MNLISKRLRAFITITAISTAIGTSSAEAAAKYYINIGCWPDYKMYRVGCDVGTPWKTCARKFCGVNLSTNSSGTSRDKFVDKAPRLLQPLDPKDASQAEEPK